MTIVFGVMLLLMRQESNLRSVRGYLRVSMLTAIALVAVGCREQPTTVEGVVTLDGRPLAIEKNMRGSVVFQPTASEGATLTGLIDAQGHYELASGGSVVVPPRTYWVTVSAMEFVPASEERPQPSGRLVTPAKYASATDSGFRIEVQPGPNQVNLELTSDAEPLEEADSEQATGNEAPAAFHESTHDQPPAALEKSAELE